MEDCSWNEVHVRDNVIESKSNEGKGRPPNYLVVSTASLITGADNCFSSDSPDSHDLAEILPSHESQKASHAHQPIGTNTSQEDRMPSWHNDLSHVELEDLILVNSQVESLAIASDQPDYEQRAGQVAPEGDEPM